MIAAMTASLTPPSTPVAERRIPTRRISLAETLRDLPHTYAGEDEVLMSHILAAFSAVIPDGEEYFVRTVRHFRGEITDPQLKLDVAGFIGQEAVHGREHRELNDSLQALGYPTKKIEKAVDKALRFRERVMSPHANLACTAALEHFTATFGAVVLGNDEARASLGPVGDFWAWHAMEECEHKAVAFDVFRATGGTERTRKRMMNFITVTFIGGISFEVLIQMLRDPAARTPGARKRTREQLRNSPFLSKQMWRNLRDYNRDGFHPDDHETDHLVEEWRETFFGEDGQLNEFLAATGAA